MEYYVTESLSGTTDDRFELHKNSTAKFLFHRFNNFPQLFGLSKFQLRHSQGSEDDYALKALQNKNWVYFIKTLLEVSTDQVDISSFSSETCENLHICKEYYDSIYHNIAGCFQEYLQRLPDLFIEKMEDDKNINLFSNIELKNEQNPAEIFKIFETFFYKFGRFPAFEKLAVIPRGSIPSFARTKDILSPFEYFNQTDTHGLVCVQLLAALNSDLGGEKNISKNAMSEFFQNLSLQTLNELDKKKLA